VEVIDRCAESESTTTLMHPSLPDDSSNADADADADSRRKDSTDSDPSSFSSKDTGGSEGWWGSPARDARVERASGARYFLVLDRFVRC
jgi:hypothetical protein